MLALILFWAFTFCVLAQCGYAGYFFINIFRLPLNNSYKSPGGGMTAVAGASSVKSRPADLPVSVLICARNEAARLQRNLPAIFAQRYSNDGGEPRFEVIVVDDCSTDGTPAVLQGFSTLHPNLRIITLDARDERTFPGKKFPLSRAAAAAAHDFLLLTDADCRPASEYWLESMVTDFLASGPHGMITGGYGKLAPGPGLLNAFSRWETLHTFLQFWSYAARNKPYMAVGRNLACRKEALLRAQQSPLWKQMPSGDDDLLVRLTTDAGRGQRTVRIVAMPWTFTISEAMQSWSAWLKQKQRHVSTGKLYRPAIKALLGGYALSQAGTWLLFFMLLGTGWGPAAACLMLVRCLGYWLIWARAARALAEPGLQYYFPLFDFGWMVYNFALSPFIFWKNKQQWK